MPRVPGRRLAMLLTLPLAVLLGSPFIGVTVAQPWHVEGGSMEPAIEDGSVLLVDAIGPRLTGYQRGDVVVLELPEAVKYEARILVKRIVALPGDHLVIRGDRLFLDGRPVAEPYLGPGPGDGPPAAVLWQRGEAPTADLVVPAGMVFVMGDHRSNSFDSLAFGPVPEDALVGRAWVAFDRQGGVALEGAAASDR